MFKKGGWSRTLATKTNSCPFNSVSIGHSLGILRGNGLIGLEMGMFPIDPVPHSFVRNFFKHRIFFLCRTYRLGYSGRWRLFPLIFCKTLKSLSLFKVFRLDYSDSLFRMKQAIFLSSFGPSPCLPCPGDDFSLSSRSFSFPLS